MKFWFGVSVQRQRLCDGKGIHLNSAHIGASISLNK